MNFLAAFVYARNKESVLRKEDERGKTSIRRDTGVTAAENLINVG